LALGAIGTAIAAIIGGFMGLPVWQMPLAFCGIILVISGPSMLIAFLKLRQRNLGPILDANGWAVNTKASINIPFGATLTKMAALPKGAERTMVDPFADKTPPWKRWVFLLVLLTALGFAWNKGYLQQISQKITARMTGQTSTSQTQPVPAQSQEQKPEPKVK
jgi:MFS family permease